MRVAVLGAGNGGLAAAADLTLRRHEVRLFEHPEFSGRLAPVLKRGGITLTGIRHGFAKPALVTLDVAEAVTGADLIVIVVPAFGQRPMAELVAPHLRSEQAVLLNPGSTGGALEVARILRQAGHRGPIGETTMLTYVCRITDPGTVWLTHVPRVLHLAAFPATDTPRLLAQVRELYPFLEAGTDVLETGLNNVNPIIHLGVGLCNAGRIEAEKGDFYFFREGLTQSVAHVHDAMDRERVALLKVFGYEPLTTLEYMRAMGYTTNTDGWYEAMRTSEMFSGSSAFKAPSSLTHRFFQEDAGYNLITWLDLADVAGVAMPVTEAVCRLVSVLNGVDYRARGARTLGALGLASLSPSELRARVHDG